MKFIIVNQGRSPEDKYRQGRQKEADAGKGRLETEAQGWKVD
jgi:hypothetical protein